MTVLQKQTLILGGVGYAGSGNEGLGLVIGEVQVMGIARHWPSGQTVSASSSSLPLTSVDPPPFTDITFLPQRPAQSPGDFLILEAMPLKIRESKVVTIRDLSFMFISGVVVRKWAW